MEIRNFRKKYDLELIPAAHEGIVNGNLVWDPLIGKPKLEHSGMPNHILNAFVDADLINMDDFTTMYNDYKQLALAEAKFAETKVNVDIDLSSEIGYPQIGELVQSLQLKNTKKFSFSDLKVKFVTDRMRIELDDFIEQLRVNNWELYDSKIRRVFMITELYYGSIKILLDKDLESSIDGKITDLNLGIQNKLSMQKKIEYTFESSKVPFAMRIEQVKTFNG